MNSQRPLICFSVVARCRSVQNLQDRTLQDTMSSSRSKSSRSRVNSSIATASEDGAIDMAENHTEDIVSITPSLTSSLALSLPGTRGDYLSTGHYVTLEISQLPINAIHAHLAEISARGFLSIFSLLSHEYKLSVLHFTLQRAGDVERVLRSKDQLIFEVRRKLSSLLTLRRLHFVNSKGRRYSVSLISTVTSIRWRGSFRLVHSLC